MKVTLHIPTEKYGFISAEYETDGDIAYNEAAREYRLFSDAFKIKTGLPNKEMNTWTDKYLQNEDMNSEDLELYHKMSPEQQNHVQWAKRSFKRVRDNQKK